MCHVITQYLEHISSFFGTYFAFDVFFLEILSIQTEKREPWKENDKACWLASSKWPFYLNISQWIIFILLN